MHRTFLEYFWAKDFQYHLEKTGHFNNNDLDAIFRDRWRKDEWQEILRLLCAMVGPSRADVCIAALLSPADEPDGYKAVLLASECIGEIREVGSMSAAREKVRLALVGYAKASKQGDDSEAEHIQMRSISELARGWQDDPATLTLLKHFSVEANEPARSAAFAEIVERWFDHAETSPFLQDRAANDPDWSRRQQAVQELGKSLRHNRSVAQFLMIRAVEDEFWAVRQKTMQVLQQYGRDDPSVAVFLKKRGMLSQDGSLF